MRGWGLQIADEPTVPWLFAMSMMEGTSTIELLPINEDIMK